MKAVYRRVADSSLSFFTVHSASVSHYGDVILNQHINKNYTICNNIQQSILVPTQYKKPQNYLCFNCHSPDESALVDSISLHLSFALE